MVEHNDSLNDCPNCGGPADNGHDRCHPPTAYWCTKCMKTSEPPIDIARNALIRIQSDAEHCYGKPFDWTAKLGVIAKEALAAMGGVPLGLLNGEQTGPVTPPAKPSDITGGNLMLVDKDEYMRLCKVDWLAGTSELEGGIKDAPSEISVVDKALENAAYILANFKGEGERTKLEEWEACYAMLFTQMNDLVQLTKPKPVSSEVTIDAKIKLRDEFIVEKGLWHEFVDSLSVDGIFAAKIEQPVGLPLSDKMLNMMQAHLDGVYKFSARENCDELVTDLIEHALTGPENYTPDRISSDYTPQRIKEEPVGLSSDRVRIGVGCAMENYECSHKEWDWNDMAKEAIKEIQRLCQPVRESGSHDKTPLEFSKHEPFAPGWIQRQIDEAKASVAQESSGIICGGNIKRLSQGMHPNGICETCGGMKMGTSTGRLEPTCGNLFENDKNKEIK